MTDQPCQFCARTHRSTPVQHACFARALRQAAPVRNGYDAITHYTKERVPTAAPDPGWQRGFDPHQQILPASTVLKLFAPALEPARVNFDNKGRGESLNHDLYAYTPASGLALVQSRLAFRERARHFLATRKTYALLGHNEVTGQAFAHPVSSAVARGAIRAGSDPIIAAQCWIFNCTPAQLAASSRQGDVLCIPELRVAAVVAGEYCGTGSVLAGSHVLQAREIRQVGTRVYALDPTLTHTKDQHATLALSGWYRVQLGREAPAWNFAERKGD